MELSDEFYDYKTNRSLDDITSKRGSSPKEMIYY